jgi:hypothetical protein
MYVEELMRIWTAQLKQPGHKKKDLDFKSKKGNLRRLFKMPIPRLRHLRLQRHEMAESRPAKAADRGASKVQNFLNQSHGLAG